MNKRLELLNMVLDTQDEKLIDKLNAFINGYYSNQPLKSDFLDEDESDVNAYNVKERIIKNIINTPEDYEPKNKDRVSSLEYLGTLYHVTKIQLLKIQGDVCNK